MIGVTKCGSGPPMRVVNKLYVHDSPLAGKKVLPEAGCKSCLSRAPVSVPSTPPHFFHPKIQPKPESSTWHTTVWGKRFGHHVIAFSLLEPENQPPAALRHVQTQSLPWLELYGRSHCAAHFFLLFGRRLTPPSTRDVAI